MNRGEIVSNVALFGYAAYMAKETTLRLIIALYLFATVFNTVLKYAVHKILPGESWTCRPEKSCYKIRNPQELGMPSGHAQTIFTLLGYFAPNELWHYIAGLIVMIGRVDGGRHTILQVIVGAMVGYWSGKMLRQCVKFNQLAGVL